MSIFPDVQMNWGDPVCCSQCGITILLPHNFLRARMETGGDFHCPNGHVQRFRTTEVERLKKMLAAEQQALAERTKEVDRVSRSRDALKGQLTKAKSRISNGVCPCCNRTFTNLGRHMHTKHPDWKTQDIG